MYWLGLDLNLESLALRRLLRDGANGCNSSLLEGFSQGARLYHFNHVGDGGRAGKNNHVQRALVDNEFEPLSSLARRRRFVGIHDLYLGALLLQLDRKYIACDFGTRDQDRANPSAPCLSGFAAGPPL